MNEQRSPLEEATQDQRLLRLYRYWDEQRQGRRFPGRDDISPIDFAYALGRVSIIEVRRDALRFFYRLVSSRLTEHLGYEMSGKFVDDIPDIEMREFTRAFYERALEGEAPLHEAGTFVVSGQRWWHEVLVLPLASDGGNIDMLLIYRNTLPPVEVTPPYRPG